MLWFSQLDWVLFTSALISSTLFPGGSEALLLLRLQEGHSHVHLLILMATIGNVLGSIITYSMGRFGFQLGHRWFQIDNTKQLRAEAHFNKFGKFALLFAWLPIIGDPLCLVAGALRYSILWFVLLVTLGKLTRYILISWPFF